MNALELHNVCKSYPGFSLEKISFTLPSGCILGLIGENGAGKSTTIKLIMDAIARDSGEILVLGQENTRNFSSVKEDIGVVLDEAYFPECLNAMQVGKIMAKTFRRWDTDQFQTLLQQFSLPEKKPFSDFSRGMKMKLAIAVALSHDPKLLLLDEATSGLDPIVRDEILDIFYDFTREENHSILISSHIVSDLEKLCDYIAFIHKGKLLFCKEKDLLLAEYAVVHCGAEEFKRLPQSAIIGSRSSAYGVEALLQRQALPSGMVAEHTSLEDIMLLMVREGRKA